jgi:hypothetical protein
MSYLVHRLSNDHVISCLGDSIELADLEFSAEHEMSGDHVLVTVRDDRAIPLNSKNLGDETPIRKSAFQSRDSLCRDSEIRKAKFSRDPLKFDLR